jgi:hypothetical protein
MSHKRPESLAQLHRRAAGTLRCLYDLHDGALTGEGTR